MRWLGSDRLSFRDLWVIVRNCPRESALARALAPVDSAWSDTEYLLADAVDLLSLLVWFKTKDGSKNRNRPEPRLRPGDEPKQKTYGTTAVPMDEMARILGWEKRPELTMG